MVVLLSVLVLCTACAESSVLPTPRPTAPPAPSPTPSPTPEPKTLTVCLPDEPESLYLYGTDSLTAHHIWAAIYDGPIDSQDYTHQSVILRGLPSLADGTAAVQTVFPQSGDPVLAADGAVVGLASGVVVENARGDRVAFDGAPIPMEQMVVTFTLRSDVRWSDGEPLTAHDSIYSFHLAADPATAVDKHLVQRTADYQALDEERVVWKSVPGFLDSAYPLNFWHPLPRHRWETLTTAELLSAEASTREPLGWGPFAVREWVPGQYLTVDRNRFYFRANEGLPRLDEVTFRFLDSATELTGEIISGNCDVVTHDAARLVLDSTEWAVPATFEVLRTESSAWELLAFGISPAPGYNRPDVFEDVRVRRGIAHCVDRQTLADASSPAGGLIAHSYVPSEHPLHANEDLMVWEHDPEAGQRLLAQAGWYDEDGDGVREAHGIPAIPDGTPLQVSYHTTDDPLRLRTAELVQAQLRTCGIKVNLQTLPAEELFAPGPTGVLFGRRFDLAQFSWRATGVPLCDLFLSTQIPGEGDWSRPNVAGFIDADYDAACRAALEPLLNGTESVAWHAMAQRIFSEQLPVLPLFRHWEVTLAHTSVTGLKPSPSQRSELWGLEQVDVQH